MRNPVIIIGMCILIASPVFASRITQSTTAAYEALYMPTLTMFHTIATQNGTTTNVSIAIYNFRNITRKTRRRAIGEGTSELVAELLQRKTEMLILRPRSIRRYARSIGLNGINTINKYDIQLIGNTLNTQYFLSGEVTERSNDYVITVSLFDTGTGEMIENSTVLVPQKVYTPSAHAASLSPRFPMDAGLRSLLVPGWGQFYNRQKFKGAVFATLWAAGAAGFFISEYSRNQYTDRAAALRIDYLSETDASAREALLEDINGYDSAADTYQLSRDICFGVFLGSIIVSVTDALLSSQIQNQKSGLVWVVHSTEVRTHVYATPDSAEVGMQITI